MNWAELGLETGKKARDMASFERVEVMMRDENKYREFMADLASFEMLSKSFVKKGPIFNQVPDAFLLSISFVSYAREKLVVLQKQKN